MKKSPKRKKRDLITISFVIVTVGIILVLLFLVMTGRKQNNLDPTEESQTLIETKDQEVSNQNNVNIIKSQPISQPTSEAVSEIPELDKMNLAIVGDSISSFSEYTSTGYPSCYPYGDLDDVSQMWWSLVEQNTGVHVKVRASYSGGTCSGNSLDDIQGMSSCSNKRINDLLIDGNQKPDIIIIFNGINDYINCTPIGNFDGTSILTDGVKESFSEGYGLTFQKLKETYPKARIYCCTLLETAGGYNPPIEGERKNSQNLTVGDYNACIRKLADAYKTEVIDLAVETGITYDNRDQYTVDSIHPNQAGMKKISDIISKKLNLINTSQ